MSASTTRAYDIDAWASRVPAGVSGGWSVRKFEVTPEAAAIERMRAIFGGGRGVPEGHYTGLYHGGEVVMSDTPDERRDHYGLFHAATGHVLIHGLGLGCALAVVLTREDVESVTVIERSPDVIALVDPSFADPRLRIIQADAYTWKPPRGERYGAVWHDIWPNICADNLDGMKRLHRRYGGRCDWQASWCRARCERYA